MRHVSAEAKKLEDSDHSLGFVNERNKLLGLFVGKTGRSASRDLKTIVKGKLEIDRKVAKAQARAAKRTSRPAKKLTSRKAKPVSFLAGTPRSLSVRLPITRVEPVEFDVSRYGAGKKRTSRKPI